MMHSEYLIEVRFRNVFVAFLLVALASALLAPNADAQVVNPTSEDQPEGLEEIVETLLAKMPGQSWQLTQRAGQSDNKTEGIFDDAQDLSMRFILSKGWKKNLDITSQVAQPQIGGLENWKTVQEQMEFVLIPKLEGQEVPHAGWKVRIPWSNIKSTWHQRPVYMGEKWGYAWFCNTTLYDQEFVRKALEIQGGEDRIQLLVDGLAMRDSGGMTSNSCDFILREYGDTIIPYIRRKVEEHRDSPRLGHIIRSLAGTRSEAATSYLLELYADENPELRSAAEYPLIHKPYRESAKSAYLDMLRRASSIAYAGEACVEFNWTEAKPILREQLNQASSVSTAVLLAKHLHMMQAGKDSPELQSVLAAYELLRYNPKPGNGVARNQAIETLKQSKLGELVNWLAFSLANYTNKASVDAVRADGIEILSARPRVELAKFILDLRERGPRMNDKVDSVVVRMR
ncbi:MAG: hypothetical protein AAF483_17640 [Planctomycetota bacterium]